MDLKQTVKNLRGNDLVDGENKQITFGEVLANIILSDKEIKNPLKQYALAQKLYSESNMNLDKADTDMIKEAVERTEAYSILVSGQILSQF